MAKDDDSSDPQVREAATREAPARAPTPVRDLMAGESAGNGAEREDRAEPPEEVRRGANAPQPDDGSTPAGRDRQVAQARRFHRDGTEWIARLAGSAGSGAGSGRGLVELVRFVVADDGSGAVVREILVTAGRFEHLFEAELIELLGRATPRAPGTG